MKGPSATDEELEEMCRAARRFVPKHRLPRWLTVLRGAPSKWDRLEMDDLFRVADQTALVRTVEIEDELETPDLADDPPATLFRFSAKPFVLRGRVRELVAAVVEADALISVHAGKVLLAAHHSSGWIVCRSD